MRKGILVKGLVVVAGLLLLSSSNAWAEQCVTDLNCDGEVNKLDQEYFDFNGDGKVNWLDWRYIKQAYNAELGMVDCDSCSSCPSGLIDCGGSCTNPMTDRNYCGATEGCLDGTVCGDGEMCVSGVCELNCPSYMTECDGTLSAGGRWCNQGDGTVKDMSTGLVWLKDASCMGLMDWYSAIEQPITNLRDGNCSGTLTDGSEWGDWRLSTKTELVGITVGTEYISSRQMHSFTGVQSSDNYWSSTTYASNSDYAWYVDMYYGFVYHYYKTNFYYVWPVRGDID